MSYSDSKCLLATSPRLSQVLQAILRAFQAWSLIPGMPGIVVEPDSIKEVRIKGASIQGRLSVKLRNEELERGTWEDEHGMK